MWCFTDITNRGNYCSKYKTNSTPLYLLLHMLPFSHKVYISGGYKCIKNVVSFPAAQLQVLVL